MVCRNLGDVTQCVELRQSSPEPLLREEDRQFGEPESLVHLAEAALLHWAQSPEIFRLGNANHR
eukprot:4817967-Pyramimonas_sp.AAC.1